MISWSSLQDVINTKLKVNNGILEEKVFRGRIKPRFILFY